MPDPPHGSGPGAATLRGTPPPRRAPLPPFFALCFVLMWMGPRAPGRRSPCAQGLRPARRGCAQPKLFSLLPPKSSPSSPPPATPNGAARAPRRPLKTPPAGARAPAAPAAASARARGRPLASTVPAGYCPLLPEPAPHPNTAARSPPKPPPCQALLAGGAAPAGGPTRPPHAPRPAQADGPHPGARAAGVRAAEGPLALTCV
jgi:hypothetical protein